MQTTIAKHFLKSLISLPRAMTVFPSPLVTVLQVTGLLPLSLEYAPLRGHTPRYSRARVLYSILLTVLVCTQQYLSVKVLQSFAGDEISAERKAWKKLFTKTTTMTVAASHISGFLSAVAFLLTASTKVKQKINLLEKLKDVDFQLQRKHLVSNSKSYLMSYTLIFFLLMKLVHSLLYRCEEWSALCIDDLKTVIMGCGMVEYMELVLSVRDRFEMVNNRVTEVMIRSLSKQLCWTVPLPCVETFNFPQDNAMTIPTLSEIHWNLCLIVYEINTIYGWELVFAMITIFTNLLCYPYMCFLVLTQMGLTGTLDVLGNNLISLMIVISHLLMMLLPCTSAVSEAKKTVVVVAKEMGNRMENSLFKELESFAQQLFHRDVYFSANGLFNLQNSVLISVASAVTTYMAIILQFQTSNTSSPLAIAGANNSTT